MTSTTLEHTYLGVIDGWHRWDDGRTLPLLHGFNDPDDDDQDDPDPDADAPDDDDGEDTEIPDASKIKDPKRARAARQAGQYRTQRNTARAQRDEARQEVAFLRAANGQVVDTVAGWKLVNKSLIVVNDDGTIDAEDAVNQLLVDNPFLEVIQAEAKPEANPFKTDGLSSGRKMNGKKKDTSSYDTANLEKRYPALRGRRR